MPLVGWSSYGIEGIEVSCSLAWNLRTVSNISYIICLFIFSYIAPIVVICFTYYRIWQIIKRQSQVKISPENQSGHHSNEDRSLHKGVAIVGLLTTSLFLLAWTPYAIVSFVSFVNPAAVTLLQATIPALIAKSSVIYFPLVYAAKHTEFQAECRKVICGRSGSEGREVQITIHI